MKTTKAALLILAILVLVSRIFFLDAGCGAEEDAYGVRLAAKHIALTGEYEASRLPGHPLQELLYACIVNRTSVVGMNALTTFFSLIATLFFYLILRKLDCKQAFLGALAFAFTPIIYIHSTDCMDYLWAMAFILMSYYWLLNGRLLFAGVLLGMAVGCRITSVVLALPFGIYLLYARKETWVNILTFGVMVAVTSLVIFIPVIQKYGWGFFHYYDQFPYPSYAKVIYKATFGVWGTIGCLGLLNLFFVVLFSSKKETIIEAKWELISWVLVIVLFVCLFIMLPQKSAYFIPIVPFVILVGWKLLSERGFKILAMALIFSSFFLGINLADKNRGAAASTLRKDLEVSGQEIHLDLLYGPVLDDYLKRKARINFTNQVLEKAEQIKTKSIIISGWWLNPILDELNGKGGGIVKFVYCLEEAEIKEKMSKGFQIFFSQRWIVLMI